MLCDQRNAQENQLEHSNAGCRPLFMRFNTFYMMHTSIFRVLMVSNATLTLFERLSVSQVNNWLPQSFRRLKMAFVYSSNDDFVSRRSAW